MENVTTVAAVTSVWGSTSANAEADVVFVSEAQAGVLADFAIQTQASSVADIMFFPPEPVIATNAVSTISTPELECVMNQIKYVRRIVGLENKVSDDWIAYALITALKWFNVLPPFVCELTPCQMTYTECWWHGAASVIYFSLAVSEARNFITDQFGTITRIQSNKFQEFLAAFNMHYQKFMELASKAKYNLNLIRSFGIDGWGGIPW